MRLEGLIGEQLGRYKIEALIGRGGMAAVYRAFDPALQRNVALKVLYPQFLADPSLVERFRREAITAASLDHPYIAPIYDVGDADGLVYLAMKLLPGPSLAELLQREGRLSLGRVAMLASEIASALEEAHAHGIVHRDIKPGNVLFDSRGRAMLTDFGIAKSLESSSLTESSVIVGTPDYIAPEQIDGRLAPAGHVDGRADIYALGAMLYRALTGRRPFDGSAQNVLLAHLQHDPVPPSMIVPDLPPAVDAVIARAMAKRPDDRYASAGAFARDLADAANEQTEAGMVVPPIAQRGDINTRTTTEAVPPLEDITADRRMSARRMALGMVAGIVVLLGILTYVLGTPDEGAQTAGTGDAALAAEQRTSSPTTSPTISATDAATVSPSVTLTRTPTFTPTDTLTATTTPEVSATASAGVAPTAPAPAATAPPAATRAPQRTATRAPQRTPTRTPVAATRTPTTAPTDPVVTEEPATETPQSTSTPQPPTPTVVPPTPTNPPQPTDPPQPTATRAALPPTDPILPTDTPANASCEAPLTGGFGALWNGDQRLQTSLGCPVRAEIGGAAAEQVFENGTMYWWSGNQQIYVLANAAGWSQYPNTFREGDEEGDPLSPPPGYFAPVRGFGKVWRTTPAVESSLGWGTTPEAAMTGVYQRFERGTMLYAFNVNGHGRQIYVLFGDGSFDVFPDPNA